MGNTMKKFILMVLIAVFTIAVFTQTVLVACNKNSTTPSSDSSAGSESIESGKSGDGSESGSPYDDDWYPPYPYDSENSSQQPHSGSSSQGGSSSREPVISFEDPDEGDWTNFF